MGQLITVVTPTLGDSAGRLEHLCAELRRFTNIQGWNQVICDDGTLNPEFRRKQKVIADRHPGIIYVENPGPFGISYNINHAMEYVNTPWAFIIEDGLRPSCGWMEAAFDFLNKIGNRTWNGRKVGMCGFASLQDWTLVMGGAIPTTHSVMDFFRQKTGTVYDHFYGPWNDGYWCWNRMLPYLLNSCHNPQPDWDSDVMLFVQQALEGEEKMGHLHPTESEQRKQKWRMYDHWPARRTAWVGWYPGAFMLVNMELWRQVGRFRDGCTFFEAHLGVRMGWNGHLSLCLESPPFLHQPSQGFSVQWQGKTPRIHFGTDEVFLHDFGMDHMDAPKRANEVVSLDEQRDINEQLSWVHLDMIRGWEKWVTA